MSRFGNDTLVKLSTVTFEGYAFLFVKLNKAGHTVVGLSSKGYAETFVVPETLAEVSAAVEASKRPDDDE